MPLSPAFSTPDGNAAFLPEYVGTLVVQPVIDTAVATQVSNVVRPDSGTHALRVPIVTADPTAAWLAELDELTHSEATLDEIEAPFRKVGGMTRLSNEMVRDSNPETLNLSGQGLVRDIQRKLDAAFFGDLSAPAPAGLGSITPTDVDADSYANLDPFAEAISEAEQLGATINKWVTDPDTALTISTIKDESGSNRTLLDDRTVLGRELLVSPEVESGVVWGIPMDRVIVAVRQDAELTVDESRYFEYDAVAVRAVMRVAFGFPHEAAVVKISDGS